MSILKKMLELQNILNIKVAGDHWASKGFDWRLAASQETSELIDSFSWKWWKGGEDDIENAKIEAIDIIHFILSIMLVEGHLERRDIDEIESSVRVRSMAILDDDEVIDIAKRLQVGLLSYAPAVNLLTDILMIGNMLEQSLDDIYKLYIGKYVLNKFRQNNGYKDGTYIKNWNGVEDNVFMQKEVSKIEDISNIENALFDIIEVEYKKAVEHGNKQ